MSKQDSFPPLWTTYSRCHDIYFLWQFLGHLQFFLLLGLLLRFLSAIAAKVGVTVPAPLQVAVWAFLAGAAVTILSLLLYVRLWISEEGVAWRSLGSQGVLAWQELKGWSEERNPLFPLLRVKDGILILPISHLKDRDETRRLLLDKGVPNVVSFPVRNPQVYGKFPGSFFLIPGFALIWAADLASKPNMPLQDAVLNWVCVALGIAHVLSIIWFGLQTQDIHEGHICENGPLPRHRLTLRFDQIEKISFQGDNEVQPKHFTLYFIDESGKPVKRYFADSLPDFIGLLDHLNLQVSPDITNQCEAATRGADQ